MEIKKYCVHGRFHARFDSFSGLIPVKPIRKIIHTDHLNLVSEYIRVKVLKTVGAYKANEILEIPSEKIIPLKHIKYPKGMHARIFNNYMWLDLWTEHSSKFAYCGSF